jgi:hypothetical protein
MNDRAEDVTMMASNPSMQTRTGFNPSLPLCERTNGKSSLLMYARTTDALDDTTTKFMGDLELQPRGLLSSTVAGRHQLRIL